MKQTTNSTLHKQSLRTHIGILFLSILSLGPNSPKQTSSNTSKNKPPGALTNPTAPEPGHKSDLKDSKQGF